MQNMKPGTDMIRAANLTTAAVYGTVECRLLVECLYELDSSITLCEQRLLLQASEDNEDLAYVDSQAMPCLPTSLECFRQSQNHRKWCGFS